MTPEQFITHAKKIYGNHWQTRAAEDLGVHLSTIKRWKTGKNRIPFVIQVIIKGKLNGPR